MNLAEFSALKTGDRIEAMNGSIGEVTEATASGVRIKWLPGTQTFFFSVVTTAWMHWREVPPICLRYELQCEDVQRCTVTGRCMRADVA